MKPTVGAAFLVRPLGHQRPNVGRQLRVESTMDAFDSTWLRRPGPHPVGRGEVLPDGRVAIRFVDTEPARDAKALLEDGVVTAEYWGLKPVIRLR